MTHLIKDEKKVRFLTRVADRKLFAGIGQTPLKTVGVFLSEGTSIEDALEMRTIQTQYASKLKH